MRELVHHMYEYCSLNAYKYKKFSLLTKWLAEYSTIIVLNFVKYF